jgi:hypothetical protein
MPMAGRFFYPDSISDETLIVDPSIQPAHDTQEELRSEIQDFETVIAMDYKYCMSVEGACQESNLWVARNQHETGLADIDLQRFKNVAWNECVIRKFLNNKDGDAELVGKSMINIIQSLNLQWKNLQVMGLHPKIESAEKQVVMSCMENGLITFDLDVGKIARALRRCEHFADFFANAVGGQVVANSGRTPGLYKTKIGTDWDYTYKNKTLFYLERVLERNKAKMDHCLNESDHVDYIHRLTQLKIIKPDSSVELSAYQPPYMPSSGGGSSIQVVEPNFGNLEKRIESIIQRHVNRQGSNEFQEIRELINRALLDPEVIQGRLQTALDRLLRSFISDIQDQQRSIDETIQVSLNSLDGKIRNVKDQVIHEISAPLDEFKMELDLIKTTLDQNITTITRIFKNIQESTQIFNTLEENVVGQFDNLRKLCGYMVELRDFWITMAPPAGGAPAGVVPAPPLIPPPPPILIAPVPLNPPMTTDPRVPVPTSQILPAPTDGSTQPVKRARPSYPGSEIQFGRVPPDVDFDAFNT